MPSVSSLVETIPCPVCTGSRFEVVRPSRYPEFVTVEDLARLYSASSNHVLMDQVVRCRDCNLQYVNPRPKQELIIDGYAAAEDHTFVAQNPQRIATFGKALKHMFGRLGQSGGNGRKLLDIGSAGGAFLVAARDFGFQPVGVEPSRWMADFGRRTYNVDIRDGILMPGMFPEPNFDVITIWDVIEHVPDPHGLFSLINRLLKPDGYLLVSYPDVGSLAAKLLGERWPFWLSVHLMYYDRRTMAAQLKRAGFETLSFYPLNPSLPLSYILQRAGEYFSVFQSVAGLTDKIGIGGIPFPYNMGQTMLVARKAR
jgi:SAM-dependent methyltransferase